MTQHHQNPFVSHTPENLSTEDMVNLFVQEASNFSQIEMENHSMILGARGTGKSSILRFMEPDCQKLASGARLSECRYLGVLVPLRSSDNLPEFARLEKLQHGYASINEHALVSMILGRLLFCLNKKLSEAEIESIRQESIEKGVLEQIKESLLLLPDHHLQQLDKMKFFGDFFDFLKRLHGTLQKANKNYLDSLRMQNELLPFEGPIVGYNDFLRPLLEMFCEFDWTPQKKVYLLFDDAEQLAEDQTIILNSWIAQRSTDKICIKVTAQEGKYKSFKTLSGISIESPHDYSHFSLNPIYTARGSNYRNQLFKIIKRRLSNHRIDCGPEEFFPEHKKQVEGLKKIVKEIEAGETKGYNPYDDVYRYTRPKYMKGLAGISKQSSSYSYSGFDQLTHISDGVLRNFLESAFRMFEKSRRKQDPPSFIAPSIQNEVIRKDSEDLLKFQFERLKIDASNLTLDKLSDRDQLLNLINAMGWMFRQILISESSERRVFSMAFSSGPDDDVFRIIKLGVENHYFGLSSIGNKKGTGRVPLLILSRRLAPYFGLDPNGFAGYKFVQNGVVKEALKNPDYLVEKINSKLKKNPDDDLSSILELEGLFDDQ